MKYLLLLIFSFFLLSCESNKKVYWCGDHACINKKEKEAYFKKTMIVEIKNISKKDSKSKSEFEEINKQAVLNEKNRIKEEKLLAKQVRLEEKRRIKEEKLLAKQARVEEKRRIKEEKLLAKQAQLDEKQSIKQKKKLSKQRSSDQKKIAKNEKIIIKTNTLTFETSDFMELVEKITKKNKFRRYPDVNDIPN